MMAEKSHTDQQLINAYAQSELDLLYLYRWNQDGEEPYGQRDMTPVKLTFINYGNEKVKAIKVLREISDFRMSLQEAKEIVDTQLPYTLTLPAYKAYKFKGKFEAFGAKVEINEE